MYLNSYVFLASLVHHQGVHSFIQQSLGLIIISNMRNGRRFVNIWFMETDRLTVIGAACKFGDGSVSPETCNSLPVFKNYGNYRGSLCIFWVYIAALFMKVFF